MAVQNRRWQGLFQSTLPRGERLALPWLFQRLCNFNPRSHEGSDIDALDGRKFVKEISIHAPTRGATIIQIIPLHVFLISIHAPTRGATMADKAIARAKEFQSTLPRGERLASLTITDCILEFQSTLPRGERRYSDYVIWSKH